MYERTLDVFLKILFGLHYSPGIGKTETSATFCRLIESLVYLIFKMQVIALDARNHGESEHSPEMDYFAQVLDIWNLFQELDIANAVVMGHSMGGKAAMTFALSHPEIVDKLIVVDSSPTKSPSDQEMQKYLAAKKRMDLSIVKTKKDAEQQLIDSVPVSTKYSIGTTCRELTAEGVGQNYH